ncbi:MAG: cyclic pyranopterin monophosphate synthase MoaC [Turicibacter sp.]
MENKFTHFDQSGNARMVDVSKKVETTRVAVAVSKIIMSPETLSLIEAGEIGKGDVLGVARVAGIMASKQTSNLIPMCHPLMISSVNVDFEINKEESSIQIVATVKIVDKTGVEMEALTAAMVAALTIYDMCKAADKRMVIKDTHLLKKTGGKSGEFNFFESHSSEHNER